MAFGLLAGIFSAISYIPYIRYIIKGTVKPERASWLIWTVLTAMGFFTQLAVGATHSLWLPGIQALGVTIVLLLSIKYGFGGVGKRDALTLGAAAIVLLVWLFTKNPVLAVYLTIVIDSLGTGLTMLKSYEHPDSEAVSTWALSGTGGLFGILAVGSLNPHLLSYPIYIFLANYAVVAAIIIGKRKHHRATR